MLHVIWALLTNPVVICLTFFILWILTIQKKKRVEYHLAGRLANQHTINNLLVNSVSITDTERQTSYLKFVAKFVKYGFTNQDKSTISLALEIEQIVELIKAHEISNERKIYYEIGISPEDMNLPIIPFSIITIVENALCYGDLDNPERELKLSLNLLENSLFSITFSGYKMPDKINLLKPQKGHGLFILKQRLKFMHYDKNTSNLAENNYISLSPDGMSLIMVLPQ